MARVFDILAFDARGQKIYLEALERGEKLLKTGRNPSGAKALIEVAGLHAEALTALSGAEEQGEVDVLRHKLRVLISENARLEIEVQRLQGVLETIHRSAPRM